jgi:hypothetical protein
MLDGHVEALASSHRRVVDARNWIQRYEDARTHLTKMGQIAAAEALALRIGERKSNLQKLEIDLIVASYKVCDTFNVVNPHEAAGRFLSGAAAHSGPAEHGK